MTFLELAEKIINEENRTLSVSEIWKIAVKKEYNKQLNSTGKTPWDTLGALMYSSVKDNPNSIFSQTDTKPKRFYLKSQKDTIQLVQVTEPNEEIIQEETAKLKEKDLHVHLANYAFYHLRYYTKTINHSSSTKKEFGEWVHPDMVGCKYPFVEWKDEVYDLSSTIGNTSISIASFELKKRLTFSNLRESFFQAVSNSSWANESYLVAAEISDDIDFKKELSRLSTSFGIGVIHLNIQDSISSEIIFPSKFKDYLDWETINKLTMNSDFKEFLARVKIDVTSKKVHKKEYDQITELNNKN